MERLLRLVLLFSTAGMVGVAYHTFEQLRLHGLDFSLGSLLLVGGLSYNDIYEGVQQSAAVRLLTTWLFPAALLGGICLVFAKTRKQRLCCLLWLIPSLFFSLVNGARANSLMCIILALGGYLSMRIAVRTERHKLSIKRLVPVGMALIVAVCFWLGIDAVRGHTDDSNADASQSRARLKGYAFGYLPTLSYWIDQHHDSLLEPGKLTLGAYTFGGIFDSLGIQQRKRGVYQEFVWFGDWTVEPDQVSNIYTAFRGVVEDFSIFGAVLFFLASGFISGWAYRQTVAGSTTWASALALCYAFWIWSPLGSMLTYNGAILAVIVAVIAVYRIKKYQEGMKRMTPTAAAALTRNKRLIRRLVVDVMVAGGIVTVIPLCGFGLWKFMDAF